MNRFLSVKSGVLLVFAIASASAAWASNDQVAAVKSSNMQATTNKAIVDPDALIGSKEEYAQRCDTCVGSVAFIQAALAAYPRSALSTSYVINLQSGVVKAVYLDWDPESRRQLGGYEVSVDPILAQYVQNAGEVYRENGNSLNLKLVVRADGSVYWVKADGSTEELSDPTPALTAAPMTTSANGASQPTLRSRPVVNDAPPNSAPIDLRGYQFSEPAFTGQYPAFPATSYDMAYNQGANINSFVRDQTANVRYGAASGVMNGTVSTSSSHGVAFVANVAGGVTVTANLSSVVSVYVPMRDGGYALVQYDKKTGIVTLMELRDGQDNMLPLNHPTPANSLPGVTLNFTQRSPNGPTAFNAFLDWLSRSNIPVNYLNSWWDQRCTGQTFDGLTVTCLQPK